MALKFNTIASIDIPTAGTRVQVSSVDTPVRSIIFQAKPGNAGNIYVGDSSVAATRGVVLTPGQTLSISIEEERAGELILSDFYVDAATNGDDVQVSYVKVR